MSSRCGSSAIRAWRKQRTACQFELGSLDTQTLFAFDRDSNDNAPVGLITFLRTSTTDMSILHVAVHPDYALPGRRAGLGLGLILIEKVKEIASRIVGVRRIALHYRQGIVIQI